MTKTYSLEGVQTILAFPFRSPGWQSKFAIGVALFFANYVIPIVPSIFTLGYYSKIMKASISDDTEPTLPDWDDWGKLFSSGLKVFGATFVYTLPVLLCIIGGYILMLLLPFAMGLFSSGSRYQTMSAAMAPTMIGFFAGFILFIAGFILTIPLMILLPPALAHVVAKDSFGAAFRIREWWAILRANLGGFFTAFIIVGGVYVILILLVYLFYYTVILCFLMPLAMSVATAYLSIISARVVGEAYRKGVENLAVSN